jgi:ABC-2 type transport system permease protein
MLAFLRAYASQAAAAIRTSLADRANFALQAGGMAVNDVFFLSLWVLFFAGFRRVGGWGREDVALLLGLTMMVVAISGVVFGGYRDMAATILRGEIDALLTQPKPVLSRLLSRDSIATAWGDGVMSLVILMFFARLSWSHVPLAVLAVLAGTVVYVSAAVSFACLAFWAAGARSFARDLTDFMLLFSSYPSPIFTGWAKVIAYTLLPAGFVVMAPVELLRTPSWLALAVVIAGAAGYAALAGVLFRLGLARYRRMSVAS